MVYPAGMLGEVIQVPGFLPIYRPFHRTVELAVGHILKHSKEHRHYVERLWEHYADLHPLEVVCMFHQAMLEHYDYYLTDGDFWANTASRLHVSFEHDPKKNLLAGAIIPLEDAPHMVFGIWLNPAEAALRTF